MLHGNDRTTALLAEQEHAEISPLLTQRRFTLHRDDTDAFGNLIAGLLMEEPLALREAQTELLQAGAKDSASAKALPWLLPSWSQAFVACGYSDPSLRRLVRIGPCY